MRVLDQLRRRSFDLAAEGRGGRSRFGSDVRGVASIEMALIFPMMLIIFVGLVDASNLMTANRRVNQTASTLGDLVTQAPGQIWTTDMDGFFNAAQSIMDPFPADNITMRYYAYTLSGTDPALVWTYSNSSQSCGTPPTDDTQVVEDMKAVMAEDNDVVIARVCYSWEPVLGIILGFKTSTVQDQIMLRPRQTARIVCEECPTTF